MCRQLCYNHTQPQPNILVSNTGKLKTLSKTSWFAWVFGWFCVMLFEGMPPLKNSSTLMVCQDKKQLSSTSSPWIVPRLWSLIYYEAFTYLFWQNVFIPLLSANKNFPVDLLKWAIMEDFGLIRDFAVHTVYLFRNL